MKRSYISALNRVRIACDSVVAIGAKEVPSKIEGASKWYVLAVTAAGPMPVAECYHPSELDDAVERWTRAIFGGSERHADGPERREEVGVVQ